MAIARLSVLKYAAPALKPGRARALALAEPSVAGDTRVVALAAGVQVAPLDGAGDDGDAGERPRGDAQRAVDLGQLGALAHLALVLLLAQLGLRHARALGRVLVVLTDRRLGVAAGLTVLVELGIVAQLALELRDGGRVDGQSLELGWREREAKDWRGQKKCGQGSHASCFSVRLGLAA
jgi:hypothetical protein